MVNSDVEYDTKIRNHRNRAGEINDKHDRYEKVNKHDDESIDDSGSEVGWNSEDEQIFTKLNKKNKNDVESESMNEDEDEDDDSMNGGMLLSDLLSNNTNTINKQNNNETTNVVKKNDKFKNKVNNEDSYDESSDEDKDDSDDSDEDDYDEIHSRLLNAIDKFAKPSSSDSNSLHQHSLSTQNAIESNYSSVLNNGDVSMNALLSALEESRGVSVLKKHLTDLENDLAAPKHIEKVVSDRLERQHTYNNTKEDMNKWQQTVTTNRHVGTLNLTEEKRQVQSFKSMVHRFVPTTPMELDIQMVLLKNGTATDKDMEQREIDALQGKNLSIEEIREKQAELAKVKALMFYDQMKRYRMNKIKSKAYRKIHNKKSAKNNQQHDHDLEGEALEDNEINEKNAYNRVKERMDLRHKNTSKWAKMAMQYGHTDKSLRTAYHESVQLGHEISEKINEEYTTKNENNESDFEDQNDDINIGKRSRSVTNQASAAIETLLLENLSNNNKQELPQGRYKKLFEMDFMKKAADQQRSKAKEDAQNILREIEEMETEYQSSDNEDNNNNNYQKNNSNKQLIITKEELNNARNEVKSMLTKGDGMVINNKSRMKTIIATTNTNTNVVKDNHLSWANMSIDHDNNNNNNRSSNNNYIEDVSIDKKEDEKDDDVNPWLQSFSSSNDTKKRKLEGSGIKHNPIKEKEEIFINVILPSDKNKHTVTSINETKQSDNNNIISNNKKKTKKNHKLNKPNEIDHSNSTIINSNNNTTNNDNINNMNDETKVIKLSLSEGQTQADLVKLAFAGPDLEAEFKMYKKQEIDCEFGLDDKKMKVINDVKAGWGDWAKPGENEMVISKKILNKRDNLITKIQNEHQSKVMNRNDHKMMNVLISQRHIKTASKYKISEIPHPFTTIEEYERSLQMPLGSEWNSSEVVKLNTKPDIKIRGGRLIEPIKLPKKYSNNQNIESRLNKPNHNNIINNNKKQKTK